MTDFSAYLKWREHIVALDPARYPAEYIDGQVWVGFWQCWANDAGCILAELRTYPSGLKEVHGIAAAGVADAIIALIPLAEQWGAEHGCKAASIESRPAWARLLKDYRVEQIRLVKEL